MELPNQEEQKMIIWEFSRAFDKFKPKVSELFEVPINPELKIMSLDEVLSGRDPKVFESPARNNIFFFLGEMCDEKVELNPFSPIWKEDIDKNIKSYNNTCAHELLHSVFAFVLPGGADYSFNPAITALNEGFVEYTTHHLIPHWFPDEVKSLRRRIVDLCTRSGFRFEADPENKVLHLRYFVHSLGYRFYVHKFGPHANLDTIKGYLEDDLATTPVCGLTEEFNQFAQAEYGREFSTPFSVPVVGTKPIKKRESSHLLQLPYEDLSLFPQAKTRNLAGRL